MVNKSPEEPRQRHCMVVLARYPLAETRVEREAMALLRQGIEVDVICPRQHDEQKRELVNGVWVHRLPLKRRITSGYAAQLLEYLIFFSLVFFNLPRLYLKKKYDVIQVHNLPDFLVFAALIPKLMGAKVILDLHDLMPEFFSQRSRHSKDSLAVKIVRWQERMSCRFADQIITVTEQWRRALIERGNPPHKIMVVMNVADSNIFNKQAADRARREHTGFRLIYYGVLGETQGSDIMIEAMGLAVQKVQDISLTIIGAGKFLPTLQELVKKLKIEQHVIFDTKLVLPEELVKRIMTFDAGMVPYRDGVFSGDLLPTKLMEFAALGFPTIAARTRTIGAYFDDTMLEFFTPANKEELASCILNLYRNRSRRAELAQNISKFTEQYNWEKISAAYVARVKELGNPAKP
jgi:glycosyltransferase involved in cell wall biosynthesis